jgi:DNA-binding response OmpR family regulator
VLMSTLRAKLVAAGVEKFIETRRGFGYVVA